MRFSPGLRFKFNAVILPVLIVAFGLLVAADYSHEVGTVMSAHAMHEGPAGAVEITRPIDPVTTPEAVGRATLVMHTWFAALTLAVVLAAINAALSLFVLRPLRRVREACAQMERGHWHAPGLSHASDEMGAFTAAFRQLGLTLEVFVGQTLQAERLATLALLARTTAGAIEPEVARLGTSAARLHASEAPGVRDEAESVARAAAAILAAVRGLDHAFEANFQRTKGGLRRP
jgi:HAMP domain-containing protein